MLCKDKINIGLSLPCLRESDDVSGVKLYIPRGWKDICLLFNQNVDVELRLSTESK